VLTCQLIIIHSQGGVDHFSLVLTSRHTAISIFYSIITTSHFF